MFILLYVAGMSYISISGPYAEPDEPAPELILSLEDLIPEGRRIDSEMTITVLFGSEVRQMSMERYIMGVVPAEMPATFEREALKAQAVAARTNALHSILIQPKSRHPQANVCADFSCCTAFMTDAQLREAWGNDYNVFVLKIISTVVDTDGVYVSFANEPILAVFHSSSPGMTEASENVWVDRLPYLRSVPSPETEADVPDYIYTVDIAGSDFISIIQNTFPDAGFSGGADSWITDIELTESGRIHELTAGGVVISGTTFRSLFDLRSTSITFEAGEDSLSLTTTGFGHGVGMSQHGANVMASDGSTYREIILAYYSNAVLREFNPASS